MAVVTSARNHAALNQGTKLYIDGMRRLIKERLIAAFPNNWWKDGVLRNLSRRHQEYLKGIVENAPGKDKADLIESSHFESIIMKNFSSAFRGVFDDFQQTQAWLMQAATARNIGAHSPTGDLSPDEVAYHLYAMAQLLRMAKLPEADAVEQLRQAVLGMNTEVASESGQSQPTAKPQAVLATSGTTSYWWQVCEPHDAFKHPATIDESLFAATLGGVHAGAARAEYLNPEIFFAHTYFTENLTQTIRDVASRMNAGNGPAVTEMQTPFGGGKTHALLTLYHLIKSPRKSLAVPGVREAVGNVTIPPGAKVLVFDGQEYGTEPVAKEDGSTVRTLWGELTYQADPALFHRLIVGVDGQGEAPGNAMFRQVLEAASPCLILIDELVSYLVKLKFSSVRRNQNLYRQTIQFMQEMLQEAGNVPGVCVLISLPKSKTEFGGLDPQELQHQLGVIAELQTRADRVVSKRTPVNDDEIYTLMSKRLFKRVDRSAAEQVARHYQATYQRNRNRFDSTIFSADYLQQQAAAYPLHPELIDVLYKKWSTATDFPRTRAVLQLLANVVADQWVNRPETYAIQSAHVNLERERVRTRIVSAAGAGGGYDAVIAADIIGGDAHADMQDQRRGGEYERFHIARGVATTLLMHSFGGQMRAGALPGELYLGTVAPNVGPEYVSEVLESLEQSLWYVHREGDLRRFQTRPNVYRIIAQSAETQAGETVAVRLREAIGKVIGKADGFRVLEWAATDGTIAEKPDPTVAVLAPKYAVSQEDGKILTGRDRIDELWEKAGGGFRQWRNALILVAPDKELWERTEDAMREVLAYEVVIGTAEKGKLEVSPQELKGLKSSFDGKKESLRTSLATAYRWVFYPAEQGLEPIGLSIPATRGEHIVGRTVERLSDQDYGHPKILSKMGAVFFNSKLAPRLWKDDASPLELGELSRRFPQWTYLPILPRREDTLRATVREGIAQKLWAVAIGDNSSLTYQQLIEQPGDIDSVVALFDGSASLVKGEYLELIREEHRKKSVTLPGPVIPGTVPEPQPVPVPVPGTDPKPEIGTSRIPAPPKRFNRVRLQVRSLPIAKTGNLQPYLFKVLQTQDAGAELTITINVTSGVGVSEEVLEQRIVEGFGQLGIAVSWEPE